MKIEKRLHNVSDTNDKEICRFKLVDMRLYVANLKRYLEDERNELTLAKCQSIATEIEAWVGFFRLADKLNLKSKRPVKIK